MSGTSSTTRPPRRPPRDRGVPRERSAMKIVFDCRYTRIGRHDGISRYTAGLVAALAKLHPVTMLISDHRQLELLPDLPWELVSAPTSAREPLVARQVNRLRPDVVFTPMQTMGGWGRHYAPRAHRARPDLLPQPHPAARPARAHPAALAALPPGLVAAADAAEPVGCGRHRLARPPRRSSRSTTSPGGPCTSCPTQPTCPPSRSRAPPVQARRRGRSSTWARSCRTRTSRRWCAAAALLPDYELHLMSRITDASGSG